jgi:hypothetical protein
MVVAAVASTVMQMKAAKDQAKAQSQAAEYNAQVERNQAIMAQQAAAHDAGMLDLKSQRVLASARAGYGAAGVSAAQGSPLMALEDSAAQAAQDVAATEYAGKVKAYGHYAQAELDEWQAKVFEVAGKNKMIALGIEGVGKAASAGMGGSGGASVLSMLGS